MRETSNSGHEIGALASARRGRLFGAPDHGARVQIESKCHSAPVSKGPHKDDVC